ncbi:hypothetical protein DM02DRAFT_615625 [Periconia macrospinosa]|uniref:UspA domain-containing protein n=1 Tax=Periconia macrospinosa TaxID=97972 RepID=A0A2V1DN52_9PLEO|nr:hypothetical protein DM02DRAFT_615625 [Periconia macrospinosa]
MSRSPTTSPHRSRSPATHNSTPTSTPAVAPTPRLLSTAQEEQEERRPSIQFATHKNPSLPRGSPKTDRPRRRISSPPPPPVFQTRVSFDTFDKPADFIEENSFTLVAKHKDYEYTKRSRTFLCGCDDNDYSEYALQWLIDELVDDGDEVVCLRVVEKDDTIAGERSVEKGRYRQEAEDLMKTIQKKNHENKAINLVLEFALGKVNKVIDEMINLYEPAILVVGTRGRSLGGFQGLLPGSVSKYCLQHSPVPVIVVRPSSKRDKARNKRALDPNRHSYKDLLEKSGPLLDAESIPFDADSSRQASEDEAAAVAAAIGYKPKKKKKAVKGLSPLVQTFSASSDLSSRDMTDDLRSPGMLMKSPELQNLDSPELSEVSSSSDEEGGIPTNETPSDTGDGNAPLSPQPGVATNVMDTALGAILNRSRGKSNSPARRPSKSPGRRPSRSPARRRHDITEDIIEGNSAVGVVDNKSASTAELEEAKSAASPPPVAAASPPVAPSAETEEAKTGAASTSEFGTEEEAAPSSPSPKVAEPAAVVVETEKKEAEDKEKDKDTDTDKDTNTTATAHPPSS